MQHAGRVSRKEQLKEIINASYQLAMSRGQFYDLLAEDNLKIYERSGEVAGIDEGHHFRFKTLGFDLSELDKREERLSELETVKEDREMEIENPEAELSIEEQRMRELGNIDEASSYKAL